MSIQKYSVVESGNLGLGQRGCEYLDTDTAAASSLIVAITFLEDTVFNSTSGLVASDDTKFPNSQSGATAIDSDGDAVDSYSFPKGVSIYGNWTQIILVSGAIIAYIG
jgi:hypothetical protein